MTTYTAGNLDAWVLKVNARIEGVAKTATQRVIHAAQVPTAKGGRMRVDTGFLRNSGVMQIGSMPSGPSEQSEGMGAGGDQQVTLAVAGWKLDGPIYFGWTASYARFRESKDGFLRVAAADWQKFINEATAEMKRRHP